MTSLLHVDDGGICSFFAFLKYLFYVRIVCVCVFEKKEVNGWAAATTLCNKLLIQDQHVQQCVTQRPTEKSPAEHLSCIIPTVGINHRILTTIRTTR